MYCPKTSTTSLLAILTLGALGIAHAEDTELYVSTAEGLGSDYNPNVLFIIDTSGSMDNAASGGLTRMEVVQQVTTDLLNNLENVNVGLMRFDTGYSIGGEFSVENFVEGGGMVLHPIEDIESARETMIDLVNDLEASGTTQLSETLYEAALYMMGMDVDFGLESYVGNFANSAANNTLTPSAAASRDGDVYISPLGQCQENHIVLLTDGMPQFDHSANDKVPDWGGFEGETCTDNPDWNHSGFNVDGDGDCLDDIAGYLFDRDHYGDEEDGIQNVKTHTIGFFTESPLLESTAELGGGRYYLADDADSLTIVLQSIFSEVRDVNSSFTSPAVSINAFDRTSHLDQLYFSVFQPSLNAHWAGNLKRYRLGTPDENGDLIVLDQDDYEAVDPNSGFFREDSRSFWSDSIDGFDVTMGGAAAQLTNSRKVFTQGESSSVIGLHESNAETISKEWLGIAGESDTYHTNLLKWARGIDVRDDDEDGDDDDARTVIGDPMHSKPVIVTYGAGDGEDDRELVVFLGTNDGYLHAFDGRNGQELFSFVPQELLGNLAILYEDDVNVGDKVYGVDGPINAWVQDGGDGSIDDGDTVYLYFGLRRGGDYYYALDVSDLTAPTLMWKVSSSTPGFGKLGQSWSKPVVAKILTGSYGSTSEREVLVFGGGYDERQDDYSAHAADPSGNAVFIVDAMTGAKIWSASDSGADLNLTDMTNAVASTVRVVDLDFDGYADRMYFGDLGGRIWRFDVHNPLAPDQTFKITGGVLASVGGAESASAADNRRFYYAPDVALGSAYGDDFLTVTVGSGYRAHPKETTTDDWFYGVRDYYPFTALGLSEDPAAEYVEAFGITHDSLQTITSGGDTLDPHTLGFKFRLTADDGEKVLAESRIFQNEVSFTTFSPSTEAGAGSCFAHLGAGRLYSIDLGSGSVDSTLLDKPGVPPEPIFVFMEEDESGEEPPDCFGPYCEDEDDGSNDPPCEGEECVVDEDDDDDDDDGGGRDVGCLVGPESCDGAATELPVRTFWAEMNTDE